MANTMIAEFANTVDLDETASGSTVFAFKSFNLTCYSLN